MYLSKDLKYLYSSSEQLKSTVAFSLSIVLGDIPYLDLGLEIPNKEIVSEFLDELSDNIKECLAKISIDVEVDSIEVDDSTINIVLTYGSISELWSLSL